MHPGRLRPFFVVLGVVTALVVGTLVPATWASASAPAIAEVGAAAGVRPAADLRLFQPGNIISDDVFFNSGTMNTAQVQAFLNSKVSRCEPGYTCLKDYGQATQARAASAYCAAYPGASWESAAGIVANVAVACGINPQVLLVMLQKEQGLVTSTQPSDGKYRAAMGQGCPDTAACDAQYYGFFNQVYGAARQMKIYTVSKSFTYYAPGKTWNIRYSPDASCGTAPVYIANQATANLYYYTPYQPNGAALAAGYGIGDICSSYGNRNFFQYFSDWFGSPTIAVQGAIAAAWNAQGGAAGWIGGPTAAMVWTDRNGGGWYQQFQNATIFVVAGGATTVLRSSSLIVSGYLARGGPATDIGWPLGTEACGTYGCYVPFQNGSRVWSNETRDVQESFGAINQEWVRGGAVDNPLRAPAPMDYVAAAGGGWTQRFLGGSVYVQAGGATVTLGSSSALRQSYDAGGAAAGALGWPVQAEKCGWSGCYVQFTSGILSWDAKDGVIAAMSGDVAAYWTSTGSTESPLGAPRATASAAADGNGWIQPFRAGILYLRGPSTGVVLKPDSAIAAAYGKAGGVSSAWGWPASAEVCGASSCAIAFERGVMTWDPRSGVIVGFTGTVADYWNASGATSSWLGAAVSEAATVAGGAVQAFRNGTVYAPASGSVRALKSVSALAARYAALGGTSGALGWPSSEEYCGPSGCAIDFERGTLTWDSGNGAIGQTSGTIAAAWKSWGGVGAAVGNPAGALNTLADGAWQDFRRGFVYAKNGAGALVLRTDSVLAATYRAGGGPAGSLGWPMSEETCGAGTCRITFDRGTLVWDASTGRVARG